MAAYKLALNTAKCLFPKTSLCSCNHYLIGDHFYKGKLSPNNLIIPYRYSSYRGSPVEGPASQYTGFEVSISPDEWKFVEKLLSPKVVPAPEPKSEYPSGWKPQTEECLNYPYFLERTKNHMLAVYLNIGFRGQRKITQVKRIQGDIWALEKDLKEYLQERNKKNVASQVHEICGHINFKGDYVHHCQEWLLSKGF